MVVTDRIIFRIRRDETTGLDHGSLISVNDIVVYASDGNALRRVPVQPLAHRRERSGHKYFKRRDARFNKLREIGGQKADGHHRILQPRRRRQLLIEAGDTKYCLFVKGPARNLKPNRKPFGA